MIRNIAAKISSLFAERSHATRLKCSVPIKITFLPTKSMSNLKSSRSPLCTTGETYDLSGSGIGFLVASIRVKENYLVCQDDHILLAELDLPDCRVSMKIVGKRYERVGIHATMEKYIVGAEIVEISEEDREAYDYFLQFGSRHRKAAVQMELGID